jgi:3-phenylpropionate/cinnamic acid dioxygenase small subunit
MNDREAILKLLRDYAEHADENRYRQWAELFEPDGCLEAFGQEIIGREKLERFISKAPKGKHGFDAPTLSVEGDRARVQSVFRFVADDPESHSVGTYRDVLVRRDGTWRFAERRIEFSARGPQALG